MVRRTKKEFKPYNDYVDRPFELKWPTAFPLGELQAAIKETNDYHSREIERLPQQSQAKIEHLLSRSIKQNKVLEIQLNSLDEYERVKPSIRGVFRGMAEFDVVLIGDQQIDFYDIRHIQIHDFYKWSENEPTEDPFSEVEFTGLTEEENNAIDAFINEYYSDGDFYEDV
ncbi:hypothetical protein I6A83_13010 [Enterococcus faecalis]|uniref:hypothetical protein n=1 Tax=Enterococcus faecalis TaxID=1351 RepID=UPI001967AEC6|nr:hypothetical protein [Enterococcus faecalis]MBN3024558.1 hypothetical protein [Enterococcus faecalis]MBO6313357.1 hypothetical protein [Enterococcus faecalis]